MDYTALVTTKTTYRDKIQNNNCALDKNAKIMMRALQSLGFCAEIADYDAIEERSTESDAGMHSYEVSGPVLLTNANQTEFLTLWDDEYIDENQFHEKYDPVDGEVFDRCAEGSWCHPPHVYEESKPNTIHCGFPSNYFVETKINQPPQYKSDNVICFYSKGEYPQFSNFYPAEIEINAYLGKNPDGTNRYFNMSCASVEHYFQIMKALEFDPDGEVLKQMGNHLTCAEIKSLGRKVQNFDAAIWNIRRRFHMRDAVAMKFWQNEELRELLLSTGDAILAEASPRDTFWGIGYSGSNPKAHDPAQWRGKNVLGNMLMYVRDAIKEDEQHEKT